MTITEFCYRHDACTDGRDWALAQNVTTMAELWERPMNPYWRIWSATRPDVLTPQQRVSWACRCVRRVWHLLADERSRTAVETAERWAIGGASDEELETARSSASSAAYAVCIYPTSAAAAASAYAASTAAAHADYAAEYAANCSDANVYDTERDWQAQELVRMFGNPFRRDDDK